MMVQKGLSEGVKKNVMVLKGLTISTTRLDSCYVFSRGWSDTTSDGQVFSCHSDLLVRNS